MNAVLYIDDQEEELQTLQGMIGDRYRVYTCRDGRAAAGIVAERRPCLVLLDIDLNGYDGYRVLSDIQSMEHPPPVVMLSNHKEPYHVVRAMKAGAADFFSKPYASDFMRMRLEQLLPEPGTRPPRAVRRQDAETDGLMIGSSEAMRRTRETLASFAASSLPVLLLGESGTGKDRAARFIHFRSDRAAAPLIVRNLAALPDSLAESELFGCERGAFTDARDRRGCFEAAHGGTLFLDEIADAGASVQAALLRVVEDRQVRKLGAETPKRADCRLIFATNREPEDLASGKPIRQDLLYRICTLSVIMPPLRDRLADIPELARSFLAALNLPETELSSEAEDCLMNQKWPGNVRQLRTRIERAAVLARGGAIRAEHVRAAYADLF